MVYAEEDLASALSHARYPFPVIREAARCIAHCVRHLHECGLVHGDIKPLNIVRVAADPGAADQSSAGSGIWRIIDLDAAAPVGRGFVGLKTSTAYVPPELLYYVPSAKQPTSTQQQSDGSGGGENVHAPSDVGSAQARRSSSTSDPQQVIDRDARVTWMYYPDGTVRKMQWANPATGEAEVCSIHMLPGAGGWKVGPAVFGVANFTSSGHDVFANAERI